MSNSVRVAVSLRCLFAGAVLLTLAPSTPAAPTQSDQIMKEMEKSWEGIKTYWAKFDQIVTLPENQGELAYHGEFWLRKPDQLKIVYWKQDTSLASPAGGIVEEDLTAPSLKAGTPSPASPAAEPTPTKPPSQEPDEIIHYDGKFVYRYLPAERRVEKINFEEGSLPLFLAYVVGQEDYHLSRLKKRYDITPMSEITLLGHHCYEMIIAPKEKTRDNTQREIWIDKTTYYPVRTKFMASGQETTVDFLDSKSNLPVSDKDVELLVPKSAKLEDLTGESSVDPSQKLEGQ